MDNKFVEVLEAYPFETYRVSRTRGAFLLDTSDGIKLLKSFEGSEKKLLFENEVTSYLLEHGFQNVDSFVKNKEGNLLTVSGQGEHYFVKNWFKAEAFESKENGKAIKAAGVLGKLHCVLREMEVQEEVAKTEPIVASLEKHTKEIKKVKTYIRNKKQKNEFEIAMLESYDIFYEKAITSLEMLKKLEYEEKKVTHGIYTYHNVLFGNEGIAVVNFDKSSIGFQITDLYYFLRKLMEKNDWSIELGKAIIEEYEYFNPINEKQRKLLLLLLIYPEKYWKIMNHYYNTKKCWVAVKSVEKLEVIRQQEDKKRAFLEEVFSLSFS